MHRPNQYRYNIAIYYSDIVCLFVLSASGFLGAELPCLYVSLCQTRGALFIA